MEMYNVPTQQDIEAIIEALEKTSFNGSEVMALCCFHDDSTPSLRFNTTKGLFICYACGEKGSFKRLASQLGVIVAGQQGDIPIEITMQQIIRMLDQKDEIKNNTVLPESYLIQFDNPHPYWSERGYSQETIERFQLGYDFTANAGTIPVRNPNGELLGVIRRFLHLYEPSKYKNFPGFSRSSNLFGSWLLSRTHYDTVVLVEGPLDAVSVWEAGYPALAQFGSSISADQVKVMVRLGISKVILMYDNDEAGYRAKKRAQGLESNSGKYNIDTDLTRRFEVYDVLWPIHAKDPGDLSKKEIKIMIDEARWINGWG